MARSNRHEQDDEPDFFEEIEEALTARIKSLKTPKDALDAKAYIALSDKLPKTKYKTYNDLRAKAKSLVEDMDEVMRVFIAEELREDYLAPREDDDTVICEHCDIVRSETDYVECTCNETRVARFAEEIGCDVPEFDPCGW
jgi:hypothetical protein